MSYIIFLLLLGWGVYKFFKFNTATGAETLRAYIYLDVLLQGGSKAEAKALAARDMMDLAPEVTKQIIDEIRTVHHGKQHPIIAEAYRRGMLSHMPGWYQHLIAIKGPSDTVSVTYSIPLSLRERGYFDSDNPHAGPTGDASAINGKSSEADHADRIATFDEYYGILVQEAKRLAGKDETDIHVIEMMEDEPFKRAFFDGIDPKELALMMHARDNPA